jgi:hypothetical protein
LRKAKKECATSGSRSFSPGWRGRFGSLNAQMLNVASLGSDPRRMADSEI